MTGDSQSDSRTIEDRPLGAWRIVGWIIVGLLLVGAGAALGVFADVETRPKEIQPAPPPKAAAVPAPVAVAAVPVPLSEPAADPVEPPPLSSVPASSAPAAETPAAVPPASAPRMAFAVPSKTGAARPVIAIIVDDMGLDRMRSQRVMDLPGPLTLSFMTYADGLPAWVAKAKTAGHEVLAHIPMEPLDAKENPGPRALKVAMTTDEIRANLGADLDGWTGYVGVNNHMGSRFTNDRARMDAVMAVLKARGLLWLDSKTTGDSAGMAAAKAAGVPALERDVFLDNVETLEAVMVQLEKVESTARSAGSAVAIGHPHDATLGALAQWLPRLSDKGFALAPVTEVLRRRQAKSAAP